MIDGLYPEFLEAGYSPLLFWDLSMGEVIDCIEAYAKRLKRENETREAKAKDDISMLYVQALQIMNMVAHVINPKDVTIQPLSVYYPGLFSTEEDPGKDFTEQEKEEDKHKLTPEMELHKARMDDFIFRHNREFAQKRGENSGRNDT